MRGVYILRTVIIIFHYRHYTLPYRRVNANRLYLKMKKKLGLLYIIYVG